MEEERETEDKQSWNHEWKELIGRNGRNNQLDFNVQLSPKDAVGQGQLRWMSEMERE